MTSLANADIFSSVLSNITPEKDRNIFRAPHDRQNPYTLVTNKLLRDTTIKHSDRGLMCQLLSWSDHHRLCIQAVVKKSIEGRDAIRGMIDRLITAGYIRMIQSKSSNGQFDTVTYQIYEQSLGVVVADLDLDGIAGDVQPSPQMDLFGFDGLDENAVKIESVNSTADGKAVSGKGDTNNNYDSRNTILSSNKADESMIGNQENQEQPLDQGTLLRKWHLQLDNPQLQYKLGMSGLSTFLTSQEQLNRFLIDFNQQHEKYKHLPEHKRLHNFIVYLNRLKYTKQEYAKHIARLRALGFDIPMPATKTASVKQKDLNQRIQRQQSGCNPFPVSAGIPEPIQPADENYLKSLEGF